MDANGQKGREEERRKGCKETRICLHRDKKEQARLLFDMGLIIPVHPTLSR